MVKIIPQNTEL